MMKITDINKTFFTSPMLLSVYAEHNKKGLADTDINVIYKCLKYI